MNILEQLTEHFAKFPGIGRRQANRFVYFLLQSNDNYRNTLIELITNLKKNVHVCQESFQHFHSETEEQLSPIERDNNRDNSMLMIVEKDVDLEAVEKSKTYTGKYFVLGGRIPLSGKGYPIRTEELKARIKRHAQEIKEIILALSLNPDGEHTRMVIEQELQPLQKEFGFKISLLGRGRSTGTELEYSDADTLENALKNRT